MRLYNMGEHLISCETCGAVDWKRVQFDDHVTQYECPNGHKLVWPTPTAPEEVEDDSSRQKHGTDSEGSREQRPGV